MISQVLTLSHRLSSIDRFTMEKLFSRESVLEHVGMVALFTLALTVELNARGADVDQAKALARAICHDLDEIVTGDVARPTKYANRRSVLMFGELSQLAIAKVANDLVHGDLEKFSDAVREHFTLAKTNDREGAVVALADILAVVAKVRDEVVLRGNRGMVRQAHTARRQLVEYRDGRLKNTFSDHKDDHRPHDFLRTMIDEAIEVMNRAIATDSPELNSDVEEY